MFFLILMVCFVVYPRKSQFNHAFEWMKSVGKRFGMELILRFDDELFSEDELPCVVFMRGYNFGLSRWFEMRGVRVVNSSYSMALALDKFRSCKVFAEHGLAVPTTFLGESVADYWAAKELIGEDRFIVKGLFGEKGEKVWLICAEDEYNEAVKLCNGEFLIQEFIEQSVGRDIRVWVVGDCAVCGVIRENMNSFKSNISAGGSAYKFELTDEVRELAIAATKVVGLEIAGVDILMGGERGYLLCEINGNAGFRSAASTNQDDIVDALMRYISSLG